MELNPVRRGVVAAYAHPHFGGLLARVVTVALYCCAVAGCATPSQDIAAKAINPAIYDPYDCPQLRAELVRVQGKLQTVNGMQDKQAGSDKLMTGAGVLFAPALATVILVASKDLKREVANLKGEYIALTSATSLKGCPM